MAYVKTIAVRLTPRSSSDRIGDMRTASDGSEALAVYVTAPPDKNKANEAMIRLLARHLDVPPSRLTILQGLTSRNKLVGVE